MALLPVDTVRAQLAEELEPAQAWATRRGLSLEFFEQEATLNLMLWGPEGEAYLLAGEFPDYPTLPPIWRFVDPRSGQKIGPAAYPAPVQPYPHGTPVVLDGGSEGVVLCAHFNRLAYAEEGGPHGDWGGLANWRNRPIGGYTFATCIAEMLVRIALEVSAANGRKAPLP